MKKILFIPTFFIGIVLLSGCPIPLEDLRDSNFYYENDFNFYPQKDTFKVGDTLWLSFSFPKNIKNEGFDVNFNEDTIMCSMNLRLNEITNDNDTSYGHIAEIWYDYDLFFKKRCLNSNHVNFYFEWDNERQKYVNEFGFILQNTGHLMINRTYFTIEIKINEKNPIYPYYNSTFQTTGEPTLQFYVEE